MLYKTNNECFSFVRWYIYFHSVKIENCSTQLGLASLNRTLHLSPHENICTIAVITIHYMYTNQRNMTGRSNNNFKSGK